MTDGYGNVIYPGSVVDASDSFGVYPPGIVLADGKRIVWWPWLGEGNPGGIGKLVEGETPSAGFDPDGEPVWGSNDLRVVDAGEVDWASWGTPDVA